ncbi:MAG: hypothetical protein M0Z81_01775 [Deltaproteobacteria bacterium]|nr:hypothetical protein [Deltaproteobacteria bacterium]
MRGRRQRVWLKTACVGLFLFGVGGCTPLNTQCQVRQPEAQVRSVAVVQAAVQPEVPASPFRAPYIPAPGKMTFCGERVPLNNEMVYERFDREFTIVVYDHAQVYLWLKRMQRYFPMIEERLRHYGLPDDLKYVAIAQTDLVSNTGSSNSFSGSTDSTFLLLQNLYHKYHNWALALAANNCGNERVSEAIRTQGVDDYYELRLPERTEHYVFRILAIKAVLSDPEKYGYHLPKIYGYKP